MSNADVMKPQHMGWWHFIRAERLFPYPTSLLHLHLHSPPPCTVRLFYKNPADSFPMLSEGHATTLGSPPPGTSCALFKHTALQKEQREREREVQDRLPVRKMPVYMTACRGPSSLRKEAPVHRPSCLTGTPTGNPQLRSCSGSRSAVCCFVSPRSGGVADRRQ